MVKKWRDVVKKWRDRSIKFVKNRIYCIFHLVSARLIKHRVKPSIMSIRKSKSKIYRKIELVNNIIHRQFRFVRAHSTQKNNLPYRCQSKISYITILGHYLTTRPGRDTVHDMSRPGNQLYFKTASLQLIHPGPASSRPKFLELSQSCVSTLIHYSTDNISWQTTGYCPTTCPDLDAVIRHALIWTQFYNMPGRDAVIRHTLVGL